MSANQLLLIGLHVAGFAIVTFCFIVLMTRK